MSDDYISTREFTFWASEFNKRLDKIDKHGDTLATIEVHLATLNGRTGANTAKIDAVEAYAKSIEAQVKAISTEDQKIDGIVTDIQRHGCKQLKEHERLVLEARDNAEGDPDLSADEVRHERIVAGRPPWSLRHMSQKQKAIAGAGLAALVIPAISDLFKLGVALIGWLQQLHGRVP